MIMALSLLDVLFRAVMSNWFQQSVVDPGRLRLFCFFVAFIAAFAFIRFSVRMIRAQVKWWPGNITPGGVHVHHVVFGMVFMCVGGVGGLAVQDGRSGWAAAAAALLAREQRYGEPVHRFRVWFQDLIAGRPDHAAK